MIAAYLLFTFLGMGAFLYVKKTGQKEIYTYLVVLFCLIIFSPTLKWSYVLDDLNNFYWICTLKGAPDIIGYIFSPEQGNSVTLHRLLYFVFFKLFWVNALSFHIVIILSLTASAFIYIKILKILTQSWIAALMGGILAFWSTSYLDCLEVPFSHFLLALPFILFILYGMLMFVKTGHFKWNIQAACAAFIAPFASGTGLLTGLWIVLFAALCFPSNPKLDIERKIRIILVPFLSWGLSVIIYFAGVKPLHYINAPVSYITDALHLTIQSFWLYLLPLVTCCEKFSLFIAVFLFLMAIVKRKEIPWRIVLFFFLWIAGNYVFIYCGRGQLRIFLPHVIRYHFYSSLGLPAIYAIIIAAMLKDKQWINVHFKKWMFLVPICLIIFYACCQYRIVLSKTEGRNNLLTLGLEWRHATEDYLKKNQRNKILMEDRKVSLMGIYPYRRKTFSYYATFLLPSELKQKFTWSAQTDQAYVQHIYSHKQLYPELISMLKSGGY